MSTNVTSAQRGDGVPELTELGRRIELLRIERGLSKQHLARAAGTSRQQLWRVMTGKSELTAHMRLRLGEVLGEASFTYASAANANVSILALDGAVEARRYMADSAAVSRTLGTMPRGPVGIRLKREYLDALEDVALANQIPLGTAFFELRRRVLAGEL